MQRGPTIISVPVHKGRGNSGGHGSGGCNLCCCTICTCIHLEFIKSQSGLIKIAEVLLGSMCQSLLINYGMSQAALMGQAFHGFLTTASACLMTTAILLACYLVSAKTYSLVRQSLFEVLFNAVACFLYLSASSYMGFAVNVFLYPMYIGTRAYDAYPAMTAVYVSWSGLYTAWMRIYATSNIKDDNDVTNAPASYATDTTSLRRNGPYPRTKPKIIWVWAVKTPEVDATKCTVKEIENVYIELYKS